MLSSIEKATIRQKLLLQEYEDIHYLLAELDPEIWRRIWGSRQRNKKIQDPDKITYKDILLTARYFDVDEDFVIWLFPNGK